jgi:hypothetical protein
LSDTQDYILSSIDGYFYSSKSIFRFVRSIDYYYWMLMSDIQVQRLLQEEVVMQQVLALQRAVDQPQQVQAPALQVEEIT